MDKTANVEDPNIASLPGVNNLSATLDGSDTIGEPKAKLAPADDKIQASELQCPLKRSLRSMRGQRKQKKARTAKKQAMPGVSTKAYF